MQRSMYKQTVGKTWQVCYAYVAYLSGLLQLLLNTILHKAIGAKNIACLSRKALDSPVFP